MDEEDDVSGFTYKPRDYIPDTVIAGYSNLIQSELELLGYDIKDLGTEDNVATNFKLILADQLIRNGHSEELRNMSELELLGYIVNALGGTVLQ